MYIYEVFVSEYGGDSYSFYYAKKADAVAYKKGCDPDDTVHINRLKIDGSKFTKKQLALAILSNTAFCQEYDFDIA